MSVLIKGMEMPKSCWSCPCINKGSGFCQITGDYTPYDGRPDWCPLQSDVPDRKVGEWDMFDLITSVYFGKRYYSAEDNGLVYSRETHKYMTKEDAISEFLSIIGE